MVTTDGIHLIQPTRNIDPSKLPASVVLRAVQDRAAKVHGSAPNFGNVAVPHIFTVSGRYGAAARAYSNADEALRHDHLNARIMLNDTAITEPLEARMRGVSLLNWHIEPFDKKDKIGQCIADEMTNIFRYGKNFLKMRYSLMNALWFGRYATVQRFKTGQIGDRFRTYVGGWEPRHGDKLVFRYEDGTKEYDPEQIGIRVGAWYGTQDEFTDFAGNRRSRVESTQHGLVYWFDSAQRKTLALHQHIIEDGDFSDPLGAGAINGVGIRSRIYWTWFAYQECLKLLLEYVERSALGIEIWRYPAHNPDAKKRTEDAAMNRGSPGRGILMVPVPEGEQSDLYGVEIIEPGLGGLESLKAILHEFFGHKIKRYISGQTLTSEAEGTGMGSGVADAHMATFYDIVKFDATGLEESISSDLLHPIQQWNFPGTTRHRLCFKIDTEAPETDKKLQAVKQAWDMGAKVKESDVFDLIGFSKPQPGDDVLQNPQFGQMGTGINGDGASPFGQFGSGDGLSNGDVAPKQSTGSTHGPFPSNPTGEQEDQYDLARYGTSKINVDQDLIVQTPSQKQIETGNYRKHHFSWNGLRIAIESPKGAIRRGNGWERVMTHHYGYIKGTEGSDGDHLDCFIADNLESEIVFVFDQEKPSGRFDEHKIVIGAVSEREAKVVIRSNYPVGWKIGCCIPMTIDRFKRWIDEGDQSKRLESTSDRFSVAFDSFIDRYSSDGNFESIHPRDDDGRFEEKASRKKQRPIPHGSHAQVPDLVETVRSGAATRGNDHWIDYAEVDSDEARQIQELTGIDVTGYVHHMGEDAIRHTIERHGTETGGVQIPITHEDIARVPELIRECDSIEYAGKTDDGLDLIKYRKRVNGTVYIIEEVRLRRRKLAFKTMYKLPSKKE